MILKKSFYRRDTIAVAKDLLGKILVHNTPEGEASGIIVETEAYLADDEACHASRGETKRNAAMFGPPGRAYIYLIYGVHHCFNAVTGDEGIGEAILVRSLYPLKGIELMAKRRNFSGSVEKNLCSGPGKLCKALGITREQNGISLAEEPLCIKERMPVSPEDIIVTTRIGISKAADSKLRFYLNTYINYVSVT